MLHLRHFAGRSTLRALFLVPASIAVAGGVSPATRADAAPVVYASDADGGAAAAGADALWGREYAALPGVRLIRVDATRHFIMADQPARLAELIDQFLAG